MRVRDFTSGLHCHAPVTRFRRYALDGSAEGKAATITINVAAATQTPAPASVAEATPTPVPNIWDAPSISGWGLAALVAGMLVVLLVFLTKSRPRTHARKGLSR